MIKAYQPSETWENISAQDPAKLSVGRQAILFSSATSMTVGTWFAAFTICADGIRGSFPNAAAVLVSAGVAAVAACPPRSRVGQGPHMNKMSEARSTAILVGSMLTGFGFQEAVSSVVTNDIKNAFIMGGGALLSAGVSTLAYYTRPRTNHTHQSDGIAPGG